uniref:Uncharacterized protein n=1 Tax=Onchocerca volvulus TaxID=6282 RepID=A0A8R1TJQ8_ONCVO
MSKECDKLIGILEHENILSVMDVATIGEFTLLLNNIRCDDCYYSDNDNYATQKDYTTCLKSRLINTTVEIAFCTLQAFILHPSLIKDIFVAMMILRAFVSFRLIYYPCICVKDSSSFQGANI